MKPTKSGIVIMISMIMMICLMPVKAEENRMRENVEYTIRMEKETVVLYYNGKKLFICNSIKTLCF